MKTLTIITMFVLVVIFVFVGTIAIVAFISQWLFGMDVGGIVGGAVVAVLFYTTPMLLGKWLFGSYGAFGLWDIND
jgi:hypothetical protein